MKDTMTPLEKAHFIRDYVGLVGFTSSVPVVGDKGAEFTLDRVCFGRSALPERIDGRLVVIVSPAGDAVTVAHASYRMQTPPSPVAPRGRRKKVEPMPSPEPVVVRTFGGEYLCGPTSEWFGVIGKLIFALRTASGHYRNPVDDETHEEHRALGERLRRENELSDDYDILSDHKLGKRMRDEAYAAGEDDNNDAIVAAWKRGVEAGKAAGDAADVPALTNGLLESMRKIAVA